ncbi:HAD family hydrolase [Streptomyces sp. NPDC002573]|uniref:HAD family hydrolase n=1 Tax=Streptomyces sp. NPDC002573 TaxID=3364651 RepID=UPI0036C6EBBF
MVRRPLGNNQHGPDTFLVTSDTTRTMPVTEETERLRELVEGARFVLFDFDGPICRLFALHPAAEVARAMKQWLHEQGLSLPPDGEESARSDPQVVLRTVHRRHPGSDLVTELEEVLTQHELRAVPSAMPTPYADPLIRTWTARGTRLAITTDNSSRTASAYLAGRGLAGCFAPHIYGRTHELHRMKPDPYPLNRALRAMGAASGSTVMIGDAPADLCAARQAGVPFLGYARNDEKEARLREEGAEVVVRSLEPVLWILRR